MAWPWHWQGKWIRNGSADQETLGWWEILNLMEFNLTLLGKSWWKILLVKGWCETTIIQFNYFQHHQPWNLFQRLPSKRSFFLEVIMSCAPCDLWPGASSNTPHPFGTIRNIAPIFIHSLRKVDPSIDDYLTGLVTTLKT